MFAITQPKLMMQHPFYSVDSTTWLNGGKYGALITPSGYVNVGQKLARQHWSERRHFLTFSREDKIKWETYFNLAGFTSKELLSEYNKRLAYSARYFLTLEVAINSFPPPAKSKKMLDSFFKTVQRLKRWF